MTSRQRVQAAVNHQTPDVLPVDFGSCATTGIAASLIYKLRRAYGLADKPVKVIDPVQMIGEVESDLGEKLGTDCVNLPDYKNMFGFANDDWKEWTTNDGTPVLVPGRFNTKASPDGYIYQYPEGDTSAAPSGRMPVDGFYFDTIDRKNNFDKNALKVEDNLEEYVPYSDDMLRYMETQARRLRAETDKAIVAAPGGTALGDVAFVPGPALKNPKGIRSIEEWYLSLAVRKGFVKELFDRQSQIAVENLKLLYQAVGDNIDVVYLCGADFGTQKGPISSPKLFYDVYLPYYQRMTGWIHQNTGWKVFKHCCGSIEPLMGGLIEAGIDILNPIQNSANNMDPQMLKDKYGGKLTFWGGGVDTQHTLAFGTPQEVYDQVSERIKIYNNQGGYIFNTIHNTQPNVPVENFMAMVDAVQDHRKARGKAERAGL